MAQWQDLRQTPNMTGDQTPEFEWTSDNNCETNLMPQMTVWMTYLDLWGGQFLHGLFVHAKDDGVEHTMEWSRERRQDNQPQQVMAWCHCILNSENSQVMLYI